jgi:outer membrane protein assembly factor BamB
VDPDGAVVFGSQDDHLYALDGEGKLLWRVRLGGDVDSSPALAPGGRLLVGADDGKLYALDPAGAR